MFGVCFHLEENYVFEEDFEDVDSDEPMEPEVTASPLEWKDTKSAVNDKEEGSFFD